MLLCFILASRAFAGSPPPHLQAGDHLFMGAVAYSRLQEDQALLGSARYEYLAGMGPKGIGAGLGGQLNLVWTPTDSAVGIGPRFTGWFGAVSPVSGFVGGGAMVGRGQDDTLAGLVTYGGLAAWAGTSAAVTVEVVLDFVFVDEDPLVQQTLQVAVLGVGRKER